MVMHIAAPRRRRFAGSIAAMAAAIAIYGCGVKGPLVPAPKPEAQAPAAVPAPTPPPNADSAPPAERRQ
jgi:predicted small lipoprotein YifL